MKLPNFFCWTKMSAEAGQDLCNILRRKELERAAGKGIFAWGIGNSIRAALEDLQEDQIDVLFSPMKSRPRAIDLNPNQLYFWIYCENSRGLKEVLPEHMLITSRAGSRNFHYALICHSDEQISVGHLANIHASNLLNLQSRRPVGSSQVTSLVHHQSCDAKDNPYPVYFKAKLDNQRFVKLIEPVLIDLRNDNEFLDMYNNICFSKSPSEWSQKVSSLKQYVLKNRK